MMCQEYSLSDKSIPWNYPETIRQSFFLKTTNCFQLSFKSQKYKDVLELGLELESSDKKN